MKAFVVELDNIVSIVVIVNITIIIIKDSLTLNTRKWQQVLSVTIKLHSVFSVNGSCTNRATSPVYYRQRPKCLQCQRFLYQ